MKWWLTPLALLVVACVCLACMTLPELLQARRESSDPAQCWLVGVSQANLVEPWRVTMNLEIEEAAAEYESLRFIYTDAAQDTARQLADVEMLLGYGIDLLVISPNDSEALRPVLAEIYQKIPVIVLDRAVSGEDYTLFIGPNNDMIGYLAGLRVGSMLGDAGGSVVEILGTEDSPPVAARSEGFARALAAYPNITLEKQLPANWLQDQAEDRFKEYLTSVYSPADVVFGQNDAMAYGAWLAAQKLRVEGIRFVGVDGLEGDGSGIDLVNRGVLEATFFCPTGGRQAVEYALKILSGELPEQKQLILDPVEILPEAG